LKGTPLLALQLQKQVSRSSKPGKWPVRNIFCSQLAQFMHGQTPEVLLFYTQFIVFVDLSVNPTCPRRGLKGPENGHLQHFGGLGCNKGPRHRVPLPLGESGCGSEGS
jgi:hypothetical protein